MHWPWPLTPEDERLLKRLLAMGRRANPPPRVTGAADGIARAVARLNRGAR